jgi:hypothetical protein
MQPPADPVQIDRLCERLNLAPDYPVTPRETFCCSRIQFMLDPTLIIFTCGTVLVRYECLDCAPLRREMLDAIELPGFRSGRDLASWLISYGVMTLLHRLDAWDRPHQELTADEHAVVARVAGAARRVFDYGSPVRPWDPDAAAVLEAVGWSVGDGPLEAGQLGVALDAVCDRDGLFLHPRDLKTRCLHANAVVDARTAEADRQRLERHPLDDQGELRPSRSPQPTPLGQPNEMDPSSTQWSLAEPPW